MNFYNTKKNRKVCEFTGKSRVSTIHHKKDISSPWNLPILQLPYSSKKKIILSICKNSLGTCRFCNFPLKYQTSYFSDKKT